MGLGIWGKMALVNGLGSPPAVTETPAGLCEAPAGHRALLLGKDLVFQLIRAV